MRGFLDKRAAKDVINRLISSFLCALCGYPSARFRHHHFCHKDTKITKGG